MRSLEDKNEETSGGGCMRFNGGKHQRMGLGKPTPSKWDDAQKWLVNLSRGEKNQPKDVPRNSSADDQRLIVPVMKKEFDCSEVETKNVDYDSAVWRINKPIDSSKTVMKSICVRDMGTEMTPIGSQEPSRAATPVRDGRGLMALESEASIQVSSNEAVIEGKREHGEVIDSDDRCIDLDQSGKVDPLQIKAMAWDEAERAKYVARFKREELKIQAWENQQKRKAEREMEKMEAKLERLKSQAQEDYMNKVAETRRMAEEKLANAEEKLNKMAAKTSERADHIRKTGHLPTYVTLKLPSICW